MKFKEYVEGLNKLLKERPESAELDVVTSIDDEGNGYKLVSFDASIGHLDEHDEFTEERKPNAVCVN